MYTIKQNLSFGTAYKLFLHRRKATIGVGLALVMAVSTLAAVNFHNPEYAQAAPTDEGCFTFNSGTNTITDYMPNGTTCPYDVEIPSSIGGTPVEVIGYQAFYSKNLTGATIPSTVVAIDNLAFQYNQLTSVVIPDSVTSIATGAFNSNQLTSVIFGNSVASIGSSAFMNNKLTSVVLPNSVTSIGDGAFGINDLTEVSLPNALTTIGHTVFMCNQLTSVTIPSSVTSIHETAFAVQSSLSGSQIYFDFFLSGNPTLIEASQDTVWYAQLYTEDTDNPNGLLDAMAINGGENGGGHLINPAQVTITYQNGVGASIASNTTHTGVGLTSYLISENTTNDLNLYYRVGGSDVFTPPTIANYIAPSAQNLTFVLGANTINFVYQPVGSDDDEEEDTSVDTPTNDRGAPKESLSNTGTDVFAKGVLSMIVLAATTILYIGSRRMSRIYRLTR